LKRKILLALTLFLLLLGAMAAYVSIAAGRDLLAARRILGTPVGELEPDQIDAAKTHLVRAEGHLNSIPAKILGLLPIAHQNLQAVDSIVETGLPTLEAAEKVLAVRTRVEEQDLLQGGRIRAELIESLTGPLSTQTSTLSRLKKELTSQLSGWLLPAVWDAIEEFQGKVAELRTTASTAGDATHIAGPMLGMKGSRTYLVILINNSELRGAGGILSGLGTMGFDNGRLSLGKFYYYAELSEETVQRVSAPSDFIRRFGRYRANSTVWVNTTASPDVPEVAEVAANLFELTNHVETDGAILLDPKGIAALMPPNRTVSVPGADQSITREELPQFIYSDSYAELGGSEPRRRKALLNLGEAVFGEVINGGMDVQTLQSVGEAIGAQHIRIVSFHENEQRVLEKAAVSGDLTTNASDNLLVTIQNFGGDKLDYWMRRNLDHRCSIERTTATCSTEVTLENTVPDGLPRYVARNKSSYGLYKGYQEIYVPAAAKITGVTRDENVVEFFPEEEDRRLSLGMHVFVPQGQSTTTRVTYQLPLRTNSYSLSVLPQPLAQDAHVHVEIRAPDDWMVWSEDSEAEARLTIDDRLTGSLEVHARPQSASGLTALWRRLVEFWREPVA
jgi:Protein of unknown function (DUF4012)